MIAEWGKSLRAELGQDRYRELAIERNSVVFVSIAGTAGVFVHVDPAGDARGGIAVASDKRQPNGGHPELVGVPCVPVRSNAVTG
jgi:hypothetical protein